MIGYEYLKVLVEEMHSTTVATIGKKNLDIMFEKNLYMKEIYPGDTREVLDISYVILYARRNALILPRNLW